MSSLFLLRTDEFDATVSLQHWLSWHRPWFANITHIQKPMSIQVKWTCRLGNCSLRSATNPTPRIIFGQPLKHFKTVTCWIIVVLKAHVKTHWTHLQVAHWSCVRLTRAGGMWGPKRMVRSNRMAMFMWLHTFVAEADNADPTEARFVRE
jgi:hypothetical protein